MGGCGTIKSTPMRQGLAGEKLVSLSFMVVENPIRIELIILSKLAKVYVLFLD